MNDRVPFRLVLISTASTDEFDNTNSSFRNRLPRPIRLDGDWEVALDDISLPSATLFAEKLNPYNRPFLFTTRFLRRNRNPGSGEADRPYSISFDRWDLSKVTPTVNGVGFMKTVFNELDQWRFENQVDTFPRYSRTVNGVEQRLYWKWKWEGDELVSDNALTYKTDNDRRPWFFIDLELGKKMGWFYYNESTHQYELGPNLKQELIDPNIIPDINGNPNGDVFEPRNTQSHAHVNQGKYVFWTANDYLVGRNGIDNDNGYAKLSFHCNWRFVNLNAAFKEAVGNHKRTLLCYSDVCAPSSVGSQNVDLLREVTYEESQGGTVYFEPHRLQHLGVRNNTLDIISVQIAEKNGDIAKFHEGTTTVTLHFRPV